MRKGIQQLKRYELKSGLLDRQRKLVLTEEYVEFENKDVKSKEFTRFNKADIVDLNTGWIGLSGMSLRWAGNFQLLSRITKTRS